MFIFRFGRHTREVSLAFYVCPLTLIKKWDKAPVDTLIQYTCLITMVYLIKNGPGMWYVYMPSYLSRYVYHALYLGACCQTFVLCSAATPHNFIIHCCTPESLSSCHQRQGSHPVASTASPSSFYNIKQSKEATSWVSCECKIIRALSR